MAVSYFKKKFRYWIFWETFNSKGTTVYECKSRINYDHYFDLCEFIKKVLTEKNLIQKDDEIIITGIKEF